MAQFAAFMARAWSDAQHAICLFDTSTSTKEDSLLTHTPEALEAWATALRTRVAGQPIAVCLEPSRGPLLSALLKDDFLVLSPSHPATLAKDREACSPSRAKDDPREADDLRALLLQHRDRLQAWRPEHAQTRTRLYLVEHRRRLVNDRTRLSKRLTALLNAYCPQVCQWFDDIRPCWSVTCCAAGPLSRRCRRSGPRPAKRAVTRITPCAQRRSPTGWRPSKRPYHEPQSRP
jgi:hypothetical protein